MKKRALTFWREHRELTKLAIGFLIFGGLYYLLVRLTPLRIPCPIHFVTGLHCPGCGVSRFFMELAQLHFVEAAKQNLAVAVLLPIWGVAAAVEFIWNPKCLSEKGWAAKLLLWGSLAFLVCFGILRNLPQFSWLSPGG